MRGCRQLLEFSKGQEKGESIGAMWSSPAGKWLGAAYAADGQFDRLRQWWEGAAKIKWCLACLGNNFTYFADSAAAVGDSASLVSPEQGLC